MSLLTLVIWLTVMWVALWGNLSWANVLGGVATSLALLGVFRVTTGRTPDYPLRPLRAARFLLYFLRKLVEANLVLAWEVVTPRNKINEGIVEVPLQAHSDGLITLVANAITLTPGTLTLEVAREPVRLYVHVLHLRKIEDVRRDVRRLEELAIRAFGAPVDRRELDPSPGAPR